MPFDKDRDDAPGYTTARDRSIENRRDVWHPTRRWSHLFEHLPFGFWAPETGVHPARQTSSFNWSPEIESFQRGDEFVVRADLPGLEKKDISVEVQDDAIVIQGERHSEHEDRRKGYFSSERSYGQFCRVVPLPEGAIADDTKATFNNGVLEVVVKAPPHELARGRRIEIGDVTR
jgi:HSP20 family protein